MAEFASLPLFTDSWESDTKHLTRAERGLYMDLLILCWRSPGCRVPNDIEWISRRLRCSSDEHAMLMQCISEFMTSDGNYVFQKRLLEEFRYCQNQRKKRSGAAKTRWDKVKEANIADAMHMQKSTLAMHPSPSPSPSPTQQQPPPRSNGFAERDSEFDALAKALQAIPGIKDHPVAVAPVIAPIWKLVQAGYDFKTIIEPKIREVLSKRNGKPIQSWEFFARIIIADTQAQSPTPSPVAEVSEERWRTRLQWSREHRAWDYKTCGPKPNAPGCVVPAHLIEPTDGADWIDFKDYNERRTA